ncbi:MAG: type II toxin-antitoxin system VapC family toxin [Acidobacteria bacterium]|nr:type II toxin-antitoxin system VapC family toxin [Acidobacteriota bacterium]
MTLLLDTHVFLWWRANDSRLARVTRSIATAQTVWVSAASAWEAAIKQSSGRLRLEDAFEWMVDDSGFVGLPVTFAHAAQFLALARHHGDPFDRMLIAQAKVEGATIVTHDPRFKPYDVSVIWV